MKILSADQPALWWRKILPLTLMAAFIFFAMLSWNPMAGVVVILPVVILAYLFEATRLWWLVIGLIPLSFNTELMAQSPVDMYLPTEPLLLGFLVLGFLYFLKQPPDHRFVNHRISWLVIFYFGWMIVAVIASSNPWVSLKSFIAQMWYVIPILYLGSVMLGEQNNRIRFLNIYLAGFSLVAIYTLIRLWSHGFPEKESQWLMQPFFKDHTILGAVLGLIMPYLFLRSFDRSTPWNKKLWWIGLTAIFTIVLIFTYSRAAILSLVVAAGLYLLIRLRISFRYLVIGGILAGGILLWNQDALMEKLSSNRAESSEEVLENIESISNISTDASNLERINRWNSAIELWKERPVFGWGPGTYQFVYAPFQKSEDLTIISTNVGDVGNAHSEFLGTLSENGTPAFLLLIALVLVTIGTGYRTVLKLKGKARLILSAVLLGYVAYFTHGILNNFLNSDKVSVLIWGFTAIIIHYDLDLKNQKKPM